MFLAPRSFIHQKVLVVYKVIMTFFKILMYQLCPIEIRVIIFINIVNITVFYHVTLHNIIDGSQHFEVTGAVTALAWRN